MSANDGAFLIPNIDSFSAQNLGPSDAIYIDTILLTRKYATDSSLTGNLSTKTLKITIPEEHSTIDFDEVSNYQNSAGISIVYRPMQTYNLGDTLFSNVPTSQPMSKLNNFSLVTFINDGYDMGQKQYYNNSFVTDKNLRYGQSASSLRGYFPTMAFFGWEKDLFLDIDFHIYGYLGSIDELSQLKLKTYPNPINKNKVLTLELEENVAIENVSITMTNILGNVVSDDFTAIGPKKFSVSTDKLAGGVYFITVNVNQESGIIRLVVSD